MLVLSNDEMIAKASAIGMSLEILEDDDWPTLFLFKKSDTVFSVDDISVAEFILDGSIELKSNPLFAVGDRVCIEYGVGVVSGFDVNVSQDQSLGVTRVVVASCNTLPRGVGDNGVVWLDQAEVKLMLPSA